MVRDIDGWAALAGFRPEIPTASHDQRRSVKIVVDCSGSMGSTEIAAALEAAYAVGGDADLHRDLLLITDGEVWNDGTVVARAKQSGHRFFTVGVGNAVAEAFVRGLAEATGGACELVAPREDMAERIHRHFQRMYAPRARRAFVRLPAQALCRVPDAIGPVYGGDTVHLFAWFAEKPEGRVSLEVTLADGRVARHETEIHSCEGSPAEMPAPDAGSLPALSRLAAARRLSATQDDEAATDRPLH